MADSTRRSTREVKKKRDEDFIYDENSWENLLSLSNNNASIRTRVTIDDISAGLSSSVAGVSQSNTARSETENEVLNKLPEFVESLDTLVKDIVYPFKSDGSVRARFASLCQSQQQQQNNVNNQVHPSV